MNRQSLLIIAIIGIGSIISGLAYGVSNGSIIVDTLTVNGQQIGEGTWTTWATTLNSTIAGTNGNSIMGLQTSTDGSVIASNSNDRVALVKLDGTVVIVNVAPSAFVDSGQVSSAQTIDGLYKVLLTSSGLNVYKNSALLTTIGIKKSDFFGGDLSTVSVSISSNGKFISIAGEDTGGALDRVVILTGS